MESYKVVSVEKFNVINIYKVRHLKYRVIQKGGLKEPVPFVGSMA